jgi:hypothetical protein
MRLVMKNVMLGHVIELPEKNCNCEPMACCVDATTILIFMNPHRGVCMLLTVCPTLSSLDQRYYWRTIPVCWQFFVPWHKHVFATEAVFGTRGPMREASWQQWMPDHITDTPNPMFGFSECRGGVEPSTRRRLPGVWSKANPGSGFNRRKEIDPPGEGNSCRYTCRIGFPSMSITMSAPSLATESPRSVAD